MRAVLSQTLCKRGIAPIAAAWGGLEVQFKKELGLVARAYVASYLAVNGMMAEELLVAVDAARAVARARAVKLQTAQQFAHDNPHRWNAYKANYSKALKTKALKHCPACKLDRVAVGAKTDDRARTAQVWWPGAHVAVCPTCAFRLNDPAALKAEKRANRTSSHLYKEAGRKAVLARVMAEAKAKGYTPRSFIVKWG